MQIMPPSEGVYSASSLLVYKPQHSFVGSYENGRDALILYERGDIFGGGDMRLIGKRELSPDDPAQAERRKWVGLLEVLTTGQDVAEDLELVMSITPSPRLHAIEERIKQWKKVNDLNDTPENRNLLRAVCLAGAYAVNHSGIYAVTSPPSKKEDAVSLRNHGIGYVADLAGFGVSLENGNPDVQAAVAGRDFTLSRLPHQLVDPGGEHGAILIEDKL